MGAPRAEKPSAETAVGNPPFCLSIPCDWGYWGFFILLLFDFFYGDFCSQALAYTLTVLFSAGAFGLILQLLCPLFFLKGLERDMEYALGCVQDLGMFLPLLCLKHYNGQKGCSGKWGKWLFYIYYPAHLLVIGGIQYLAARG